MRFNQLKDLGFISILIAVLVGTFDLFYVVNINVKASYYFAFIIYFMLINIFGIIIGLIGLLKNRKNTKYLKIGILLNLFLIFAKFFIYPYVQYFIKTLFLKNYL